MFPRPVKACNLVFDLALTGQQLASPGISCLIGVISSRAQREKRGQPKRNVGEHRSLRRPRLDKGDARLGRRLRDTRGDGAARRTRANRDVIIRRGLAAAVEVCILSSHGLSSSLAERARSEAHTCPAPLAPPIVPPVVAAGTPPGIRLQPNPFHLTLSLRVTGAPLLTVARTRSGRWSAQPRPPWRRARRRFPRTCEMPY